MSRRPDDRMTRTADRLHSAAIRLLRTLRREDLASGIGPARLSALSVLVFGGPRTLGQLAEAEQVRPATMSRIVTGLARDGLVRRVGDERDGRVVQVQATRAGRRVLERGRQRRIRSLAALLARLPGADLDRLEAAADVLGRLPGLGSRPAVRNQGEVGQDAP